MPSLRENIAINESAIPAHSGGGVIRDAPRHTGQAQSVHQAQRTDGRSPKIVPTKGVENTGSVNFTAAEQRHGEDEAATPTRAQEHLWRINEFAAIGEEHRDRTRKHVRCLSFPAGAHPACRPTRNTGGSRC